MLFRSTLIPNKHAAYNHGDDELLAAWEWAQRLYANESRPLDECLGDATECGLEWASEANAYVCSYVLAKDVHGQDLGGEYYEGAVPIVDEMVGKAGRRLAAWINAMTASASALEIQ